MLKYKEIEQTPLEDIKTSYWFILEDFKEGLNYGVDKELVNKHLLILSEILKKDLPNVKESIDSEKYLHLIYPFLEEAMKC